MKKYSLIIGDIFTIAIITIIGFITHGEAELSFLPRMLASFVPMTLAWFLLAPFFGLFEENVICKPNQLWRPIGCVIFAAPFAGVMRALWLGSSVLPIFIIAFAGTNAIALCIWRAIYLYSFRKSQ